MYWSIFSTYTALFLEKYITLKKIIRVNEALFCHYSGLPSVLSYAQRVSNEKEIQLLDTNRIIEMAWEDRTPFEAIYFQFGLKEADVKALMKKELKFSSYKLWRERVEKCNTKHVSKRNPEIDRFKCNLQRTISNNKISKR